MANFNSKIINLAIFLPRWYYHDPETASSSGFSRVPSHPWRVQETFRKRKNTDRTSRSSALVWNYEQMKQPKEKRRPHQDSEAEYHTRLLVEEQRNQILSDKVWDEHAGVENRQCRRGPPRIDETNSFSSNGALPHESHIVFFFRSEGFPRTRLTKRSCAYDCETNEKNGKVRKWKNELKNEKQGKTIKTNRNEENEKKQKMKGMKNMKEWKEEKEKWKKMKKWKMKEMHSERRHFVLLCGGAARGNTSVLSAIAGGLRYLYMRTHGENRLGSKQNWETEKELIKKVVWELSGSGRIEKICLTEAERTEQLRVDDLSRQKFTNVSLQWISWRFKLRNCKIKCTLWMVLPWSRDSKQFWVLPRSQSSFICSEFFRKALPRF